MRRKRPTRGEIDAAALTLLTRHGSQILAIARRYAATVDDAEDAYQRALEILLTKAPTTREEELVPWLKTVVKHEAFALRRQRERQTPVTLDGEPVERGSAPAATHDQAERYERLRQGAEALQRLKPQEIRCLVLRAEGLSYREICDVTGFTYTKVNRCLTEGRQALAARLAGIESGAECERMAPLLSALVDGEADAAGLAALRPHLKTCLACRARLREFRGAPARVAALVPAAAVLGGPGGSLRSAAESAIATLQQKLDGALAAVHHKAAVIGDRAQTTAELVTGQKLGAVAASAAALAGGGTAVDQLANHSGPPLRPVAAAQAPEHPREADQPAAEPPAPPVLPAPPALGDGQATTQPTATAPAPAPPPPPPPDPATEFAPPAPAATAAAQPTHAAAVRASDGAGAEFAP
jgi:RNA polymerase sigma factor (sigma-70 family)